MTQSYHDTASDLDNKKKKLQKANQEKSELQRQMKDVKDELNNQTLLLERKQQFINQLWTQISTLKE